MLPATDTCKFITREELVKLLEEGQTHLIDVRTREAHEECHIPGSANLCIYKTDFPEKIAEFEPDKSATIVIYGEGKPFKADLSAYASLQSQGYTNVAILEGGLSGWKQDGNDTKGTGSREGGSRAGRYALDTGKSTLRWVGRNLTNQHNGTIGLAEGRIELDGAGQLTSGMVAADMTKMACADIEDSKTAQALIGHLASVDFFDVKNHPEARFELSSASPVEGATEGTPNLRVKGRLTARGKSVPLEIAAIFAPVEDGFVFQSVFQFDRTQVGALYGSGRIFERLGMHLVNDLVSLDLTAFFKPQ